jgi:hypothetical protein
MAAIVLYLTPSDTKRTADSPQPRNADAPWVKSIFALFGFFSAAMHLAVLWEQAQSKDFFSLHDATFIPHLYKLGHPDTAASLFDEERKFFLQWDYVVIVVGAAVYVTVILDRMYKGFSRMQRLGVFLLATATSHIVSFGAVLAVVLFMREDYLRDAVVVERKNGGSTTK